jgi:2-polyprenyl-3-methyl-5-hydroxy-6-metoxy-1,4-benzoquinol methylase
MPDEPKQSFDAAAYWNKRYATVDVTKSGHIDLPAAYNVWLYRRKQAQLGRALAASGVSLRGARLLEVAAGSGAWMDYWTSQGVADYLGIDLSQNAIDELIKRFPTQRFLQRDLNDAGLSAAVGEGYDCIAAIDVLYHVLDDARFTGVLVELARSLKPGGLLAVHDIFTHQAPIDHGRYIRWRTLAQYEAALRAAGFEIVYRRPTFLFMVQNSDYTGAAGKALNFTWRFLTYRLIAHFPRVAGAFGSFVDSFACRFLKDGPSMEFMICRKAG